LATSAFGVFLPIVTTRFNIVSQGNIVFVILKQFGTGIVLSTAFIHLFTHAELMFGNECLGELQYEGTTAAIFMAGLFLSFLADYVGARFVQWRQKKDLTPRSDRQMVAATKRVRHPVPLTTSTHMVTTMDPCLTAHPWRTRSTL
jgi:zinc transporter 1/2/3